MGSQNRYNSALVTVQVEGGVSHVETLTSALSHKNFPLITRVFIEPLDCVILQSIGGERQT